MLCRVGRNRTGYPSVPSRGCCLSLSTRYCCLTKIRTWITFSSIHLINSQATYQLVYETIYRIAYGGRTRSLRSESPTCLPVTLTRHFIFQHSIIYKLNSSLSSLHFIYLECSFGIEPNPTGTQPAMQPLHFEHKYKQRMLE